MAGRLVGRSRAGLTAPEARKKTRKKNSSPKTGRRRWAGRVLGLAASGALVAALVGGTGWWRFTAPGPLETPTALVVPHGGYAGTIGALQQGQVLAADRLDALLFRAAIALTRREGPIHAAELLFPAHVSMREALLVLRHGRPVLHGLTVPEGLTARQIAALLDAAPFLREATGPLPEGEVLPETYSYLRDTERAALAGRMRRAMVQAVDQVWRGRDPSVPLSDPRELVVLASIVEKETGLAEERPRIARVFENRLVRGMKLQSDPTVVYGLNEGSGPLGRPLTHADLSVESPYNTYVVTGLPPGPICSPGLAALQAVAHPASGDELYFVASGTGGHNFAETLDRHNLNVAALRKLRGASAPVSGSPTPP